MLKPLITEKSMMMVESQGEYSFVVSPHMTKPQIKELVEATFGVKVAGVRTKTVKGKSKRVGKRRDVVQMASKKRAIVTLKGKDKIALFDLGEKKK